MAIKGSLREASLPDVLQLLSLGNKTGCLSLTHRSNFGSIFFDKGFICFASIVNRRDRLGDTLVKSGKLTQAQLDAAIAAQSRDRDARLGDILVRQGMLSREVLNEQIRVQIEEAVYSLFTWTEGTFNFEPDIRPERQDLLVAVRPDALLLEGARRVDEWSLIEKKIPAFDIIFDIDRRRLASSGVELTKEQRAVVRLLDARRDVQQIVDASGLVEFEVGKALYGLATAGFLHRVGTSQKADPKVPEERVEEHRNLGMAFYKSGMLDEAMRELRRVIELRPRDAAARFHIGLSQLRLGHWADAAGTFQGATDLRPVKGAVYHNLAYALERLERYDEAAAALDEAQKRGLANDPRVRTSAAIVALRLGSLEVADRLFTEARALFDATVPTAAWFHGASLAAALQGDAGRANDILARGVEAHPHAAVLFNNQSVVHERQGRHDDAFAATERGVREDAGIAQLHKNLADAHLRAGRVDDALEAYLHAARLQPDLGPDLYLKIGSIHADRSEREDAVSALERALKLDPTNAAARTKLDDVRGRS